MYDKMYKSSGITLVTLVITLVLMAILAGVVVSVSKESILDSKITSFVTELEIIQQKVLVMNKEIQLGSTVYDGIGIKYDDLDNNKKNKVKTILAKHNITEFSNYIYMSKEDLLKIGLKNIEQNVIITNENFIVYSFDGIEIDGETYYSIEEIDNM